MEGINLNLDINSLAEQIGNSVVSGLNIVGNKLGVAGPTILEYGVRWQRMEGLAMLIISSVLALLIFPIMYYVVKSDNDDKQICGIFVTISLLIASLILLFYGIMHYGAPEAMLIKEAINAVKGN